MDEAGKNFSGSASASSGTPGQVGLGSLASEAKIAYFSMEIALNPAMPTYSGGLSILAGDMIRAAADRELPMVAVTLLHLEGCIEGVTGWAIGELPSTANVGQDQSSRDAASLNDKLERVIVPLFYNERERYIDVMRHAIALNGSFFNTQRMVLQYVARAYLR
jgi:glucan phosphorylase